MIDINDAKNIIKALPPHIGVNLRGQPGIGKSAGIYQLAREIEARCYTFLACTMDPTDMSGIPFRVPEGYTKFAPPYWAYELSTAFEDYQGPAIAFFDDLPTADEHVQAAFFRFVHERKIGEFVLRDNVRIISAGNRVEDKAAAREMPTPLRNRFMHLDIDLNVDKWVNWAIANDLHHEIIAFIRKLGKLNNFDEAKKRNWYSFATPRSWHLTSDAVKALGGSITNHMIPVAGLIGEGIAIELINFSKHAASIKSAKDILADPEGVEIPKSTEIDVIHATIVALGTHIGRNPRVRNARAALKYALRLEPEWSVLLSTDISNLMGNPEKVPSDKKIEYLSSPEFTEVTGKHGTIMPGR